VSVDGTATTDGAAPVLEVRDLVVNYGGAKAVDGVSFRAARGEVVGIVGPNGAGKSSLLAAIGGQMQPSTGTILLDGRDVTHDAAYRRARKGISRTFQDTSEFARMTVFENLLVAGLGHLGGSLWHCTFHPARQARRSEQTGERAWQLLERFELAELSDAYGAELSGGQRRLVEVMRCLMRDPSVLLLDEPTVGVAQHLSKQLMGEYRKIRDDGVCVVIIEHVLEVVEQVCDRVIVMDRGTVIAEGTFAEVMRANAVQTAYFG
jgi:branched-chain amino acid transport system ATP-binding protein